MKKESVNNIGKKQNIRVEKSSTRSVVISIVISLYFIFFFALNICLKDKDISSAERRNLVKMPKLDYTFSDKFEKYALDQFAFRDEFRGVKTAFNLYALNKKDNNKLVLKDGYIYKLEYPTNYKSIDNFTKMVDKISLDLKDNMKYISVIPDKGYFLDSSYPKLDYEYIFNMAKNLDDVKYISLNDTLKVTDYFKTDTHWKEEKLFNTLDKLSKAMNFKYTKDYKQNTFSNFKGIYYGQLALNLPFEELSYLTSANTNTAKVSDIEHLEENTVYNLSKLNTFEPYDIFLNGSTPVVSIENTKANTSKELIIFRDSFASSLAPLLVDSYKKITLVDLRYIDYNILSEYVDIKDQDILFIYSTILINNSESFKY